MAADLPSAPRTVSERFGLAVAWTSTSLVLLFLLAPILAIIPLSFSSGSFLTYPLPGWSLRWYEELLSSEKWLPALRNSLIVGLSSTLLATVLGTLAAMGLTRARFPMKPLVMALLMSPMIVPVVITAIGVYFAFAPLRLTGTYTGLIIAHTALGAPFVVITVSATLSQFDSSLARAASSLGAPPLVAFRRVILPIIVPGVASGALFAFATSFDEVVVALMIAGPEQRTLPREMFIGIRESINPAITAVATVLIVTSVLLLLCLEMLRRRSAQLAGGR
ncbi:putative ABC transpoter (Permease component) [uncultured Pleomorphomonas sp.]|uniref:Putative ABC transpoter (Permease component) n=1 Tax=uncultured Pleomorphomonas sp. TaxID=442121 RepID=A0A212LFY7_9HYPH|nr:ABC transporter permease [uncultured Pleomorphomonas sp.]SCM76465.1 putative ABC transpoter (Permease component) [uncultured Pleomorphomonas sp.]